MTTLTTNIYATQAQKAVAVARPARPGFNDVAKRALDIVGAAAGLVVTLPLIALAAAIIKIKDPGPVIYTQWRVGRNGRLFRMLKLRTMFRDAEHQTGAVCAAEGDSRVIPACKWMRHSHLDEVIQLYNVFRGEMSLVGPRPERPELMDQLRHDLIGFEHRLCVRPGLTGLAQVRMGYASDLAHHRRKLRYDMLYIRRNGVITDIKLIGATIASPWDKRAA